MKSFAIRMTVFGVIALLTGCAVGPQQLNDPARAVMALDTANLLPPRQIPFETQRAGSIDVSYNLFFVKGDNFSGYRLTLILRNVGATVETVVPSIELRDAAGFLVAPYEFGAFISEAAILAGTAVPAVAVAQQSSFYSTGTVRNVNTGNVATFSGTTRSIPSGGFAQGFAQGAAQGAAMRARNDRDEGRLMMRWANSFWLKSNYVLPPGTAVTGALLFPASQVGAMPLRLTVGTGNTALEFLTVEKP
jgi:hypothetical protein